MRLSYFARGNEERETNNVIQIYGFEDRPLFLPIFFLHRYFVVEVCRQYFLWLSIFEQKEKRQFISFPFTIGKVTAKNTTHTLIVAKSLDAFNLSEVKFIKCFNRGRIFMDHLDPMRYGNSFPRSREQGEQSHSVDKKTLVDVGQIVEKEIIATGETSKQRGANHAGQSQSSICSTIATSSTI